MRSEKIVQHLIGYIGYINTITTRVGIAQRPFRIVRMYFMIKEIVLFKIGVHLIVNYK